MAADVNDDGELDRGEVVALCVNVATLTILP
eukprot:SAG11_NODE_26989_length_338_cov_1.079498_1_plen_30_part_01